ncbi:hypothetical protein D3C81_1609320 [compost metagenome]
MAAMRPPTLTCDRIDCGRAGSEPEMQITSYGAAAAQPSAALPSATSTLVTPALARLVRASSTSSGTMSTVSTWRARLASRAAM